MSDLDLPLAVRMMQDGYLMEIQDLKAENADLRELVAYMWRELAMACAEQVVSHEALRKVSDRMRELEVDA